MWIDLLARNETIQINLLIVMLIISSIVLLMFCNWAVKMLLKYQIEQEKKALQALTPKVSTASQFMHHRKHHSAMVDTHD